MIWVKVMVLVFIVGLFTSLFVGMINKKFMVVPIILTIVSVAILIVPVTKYLNDVHKQEIERVIKSKGGKVLEIERKDENNLIRYTITYEIEGVVKSAEYLATKIVNDVHAKDRFGRGDEWTFYETD
ncbi:hypothetical protein [Paenibacillus tarimensis]|uniref:hypothetical protein n=1 Tax=Paenibacillus tarimensis TaxID=416012 RepID=UPI001F3F4AF6|nr:hypothetical protein [Paenibacillus tarimensis]MCF2946436.1 hypothetical protein [Paenibacillus tarimensis]